VTFALGIAAILFGTFAGMLAVTAVLWLIGVRP